MKRRLLVLRPHPGAAATAERAAAAGFDVAVYPLFAIMPLAWAAPDPALFDALLLTSASAVRHAGPDLAHYAHLPVAAVGEVTALAAREAGFVQVVFGSAGVQAIVRDMALRGHARILHLAGRDVRSFDALGLMVTRVPVYEAQATGDAQGLADLVQPGDIAVVHSPRAAIRLASLLPPSTRATVHLLAISPAALEVAGTGWASAHAAPHPHDNALLALAASLCE
jgi:uroporphyrinogen-III synthase